MRAVYPDDLDVIRLPRTTWNTHWINHHKLRYIEDRLVALGRADIIEDAEKYAEERMK